MRTTGQTRPAAGSPPEGFYSPSLKPGPGTRYPLEIIGSQKLVDNLFTKRYDHEKAFSVRGLVKQKCWIGVG